MIKRDIVRLVLGFALLVGLALWSDPPAGLPIRPDPPSAEYVD